MADKTVTVHPSGGDYTTLAAAIAGELLANADLVTMAGILTISIEGTWSSDDTTAVDVDGFTTSASYYVHIVDNSGGTYRLNTSANPSLYLHDQYHRVTGITVKTSGGSSYAIRAGNGSHVIDRCKIVDSTRGIYLSSTNCIVVNCAVDKVATRGIYCAANTAYLYNNTICNSSGTGIEMGAFTGITLKNCYSGGNTGDDYSGTGSPTLTTCYSEDGTLSTSTAAFSTDTFTSVTSGSADLTLVTGSALIGSGTDLSADATYPFDWDITGAIRSTWDVGAYWFDAGGGGISIPVVLQHLRNQGNL